MSAIAPREEGTSVLNTEAILKRLQGVRRSSRGWIALCPAHADKNPSLSIDERDGKILLHCFGGCTKEAVLAALEMEPKDLFAEAARQPRKRRIVAEYPYTDERGTLLYQNVRFDPKGFQQRRPDGRGGWTWNLDGVPRVLYNLPAVVAASGDVFFVEGEKDCATGEGLGLTVTTSGAAGSWRSEYAETLRGKRVVIIADADEPGKKHARQMAASLYGKAESVKVLELPGAKDLSEWVVERGGTREALLESMRNAPEWKPQSINGAEVLWAIFRFVRRFVALSDQQAVAVSLWIAHTHAIDSADATPYLAVTSAEKQCGKSRLLEVAQTLVANPWLTGRATAAVLVRKIEADKPTLLLDESDAAFGGEKEYAEALRGILNTGHRRGGAASLCVGKGAEISFKDFSTFGAKCIAGIGKLPDTVADRSIPIRLKRAAPGEVVERFRLRDVTPVAGALRAQIETWCNSTADSLRDARPDLPSELSDRQQDGAEPLLAIADAAGQGWLGLARAALVDLCAEAKATDDSKGFKLLTDIRHVFESRRADKLFSSTLVVALAALESSPWGEWSRGKPLTAPKLAKLLHPYGVMPHTIRIGAETSKGYELDDFEDSFRRYLRLPALSLGHSPGSKPSHPSHVNTDAGFCDSFKTSQNHSVTAPKWQIGNTGAGCDGVTLLPPP
jgi:hypothetical protein